MGNILSCKVNYINSLIDWYLKATPCEKGHIFPSFPCQSDANKLPKTEGKNRSSLACCPAGLVFAVKCNLSLGLETWFFFFSFIYICERRLGSTSDISVDLIQFEQFQNDTNNNNNNFVPDSCPARSHCCVW